MLGDSTYSTVIFKANSFPRATLGKLSLLEQVEMMSADKCPSTDIFAPNGGASGPFVPSYPASSFPLTSGRPEARDCSITGYNSVVHRKSEYIHNVAILIHTHIRTAIGWQIQSGFHIFRRRLSGFRLFLGLSVPRGTEREW